MAPPTSGSTTPLTTQQKLLQLAKTLQFSWFTGHVLVLIGVIFYSLSALRFSVNNYWARFWYREAYFAVIVTYGIVLYRSYRSSSPSVTTILCDDNAQYLAIALLWFSQKPLLATLPPFAIYSFFHVLTYVRTSILPTIGQSSSSSLSSRIQSFVDNYNDKFTSLVANLELILLVRIFFNALLWRKGSWIALIIYGCFIRFRYEQSAFTKLAVRNWEVRFDSLIAHPAVPAVVKNGWIHLKTVVKNAAAQAARQAAPSQTAPSSSAPEEDDKSK
ncbi:hypothetical protein V1511DRAFT_489323 [Dipodascopsis uninucleata]